MNPEKSIVPDEVKETLPPLPGEYCESCDDVASVPVPEILLAFKQVGGSKVIDTVGKRMKTLSDRLIPISAKFQNFAKKVEKGGFSYLVNRESHLAGGVLG